MLLLQFVVLKYLRLIAVALCIHNRYCLVAWLNRDEADAVTDCRDYNFDMTALADHLRRQIDQNKNASYFNIDILKYQVVDSKIFVVEHITIWCNAILSIYGAKISCAQHRDRDADHHSQVAR